MVGESRRTILCLSHLRWDTKLFQRPQQLMLRLSRKFNVLYVQGPSFLQLARDLFSRGKNCEIHSKGRLVVYSPFALPTCFRKFSPSVRMNERLLPIFLKRKMKSLHFEHPILWIYHPWYAHLLGRLSAELTVYDCMDDFVALSAPWERERIVKGEEALLRRAHLVFAGGHSMAGRKRGVREDIRVFPSAVEVDHFRRALREDTKLPGDVKDIPRPILGYWGAIDARLDHSLLEGLGRKHPDWSIVLVGPIVTVSPKELAYLKEVKNIFWLGPKEYSALPNYAKAFDVCLNPFALSERGKYLSPTKTLEYLAAGKPVVSTPIPDVEGHFNGLVTLAQGVEGFSQAITSCLAEDNERLKQKRVAFTEGKTWENTTLGMEKLMLSALAEKERAVVRRRNDGRA